jgi:hypothetical protein
MSAAVDALRAVTNVKRAKTYGVDTTKIPRCAEILRRAVVCRGSCACHPRYNPTLTSVERVQPALPGYITAPSFAVHELFMNAMNLETWS